MLSALIATGALAQEASRPTEKRDSTLRELHFIVTDNGGHSLNDIRQDEIQVIEDGAPQKVESFSQLEFPVHYGLVIDTSHSLNTQFPKVIETAKKIVASNRPDDKVFIVRFIDSSRIEKAQEMTSDKSQLLTTLNELRVGGEGQTALIDAVYVSVQELLKVADVDREVKHRQAMVLITDGEDRMSFYKEEELFKLLQKGNFRIFVIGLVQELDREGGFIRMAPRERAIQLIERLTKETGGRAFFPKKPEDFPNVVTKIAHDLHLQYVAMYRAVAGPKKKNHKVEVKISDTNDKNKRRAILKSNYNTEQLEWTENKKP
jgi:Ca-activated chloride channel family protein